MSSQSMSRSNFTNSNISRCNGLSTKKIASKKIFAETLGGKSMLAFVLVAAVLSSALVFDGISRRRAANTQFPAKAPATTLPTGGSGKSPNGDPNSSNLSNGTQPSDPVAAAQANPTQDTTVSDGSSTDGSQAQAVGSAVTINAQSAAVTTAQPITAVPSRRVVGVTAPPSAAVAVLPAIAVRPDSVVAVPAADDALVVPAGTALTVRLAEELGSSFSQVNQSFSATLDHDVIVNGQIAIPSGAVVTGKVVDARPFGQIAGEANLRLEVISVSVNDDDIPVVTSIQSFGPRIHGKNKVNRFVKGLVKRALGDEREVFLAEQSACSFTLRRNLEIR